jgi:hypothetical protein
MNSEKVKSIIDRRILSLILEGYPIEHIVDDLKLRSGRFLSIVSSCEEIEILSALNEPKSITEPRIRFSAYYYIIANKRISDLSWIQNNHSKFSNYTLKKLFGLIQFREKMIDNTIF